MDMDFHVMSRRYRCACCQDKYNETKRATEAVIVGAGGGKVVRSDINADA